MLVAMLSCGAVAHLKQQVLCRCYAASQLIHLCWRSVASVLTSFTWPINCRLFILFYFLSKIPCITLCTLHIKNIFRCSCTCITASCCSGIELSLHYVAVYFFDISIVLVA